MPDETQCKIREQAASSCEPAEREARADELTNEAHKRGGFLSKEDLIAAIVGSARLSAVSIVKDGEKLVRPVSAKADVDKILNAHFTGLSFPVPCLNKGATFTVNDASAFGVYPVQGVKNNTAFISRILVIDIDGAGHAAGLPADKVLEAVNALLRVFREAGLNPILERSHGGTGYHIWVLFLTAMPAAFVRAIGIEAKRIAGYADCQAVEVFPKQDILRPGGCGTAISLLLPGCPRVFGGGSLLTDDLAPADVSSVHPADPQAVERLMLPWRKAQEIRDRVADKREPVERFRRLLRGERLSDADVDLDIIARAHGEIVDDYVTSPDILRLRCPHHGGGCLYVRPSDDVDARFWKCHACGNGGGGHAASRSLIAFLKPGIRSRDIEKILAGFKAK